MPSPMGNPDAHHDGESGRWRVIEDQAVLLDSYGISGMVGDTGRVAFRSPCILDS